MPLSTLWIVKKNGDTVTILSISDEKRHKSGFGIDKIREYIKSIELLCTIRRFIASCHFVVL